jgi:outer membrane protein assembly factor BamD (BamD/ComL family)
MSGCSHKKELYEEKNVKMWCEKGKKLFDDSRHPRGADSFSEAERHHPHSKCALKAQLMKGDPHYRGKKYEDTINNFRAFVKCVPHTSVQRAFSLKKQLTKNRGFVINKDMKWGP